MKLKINRFVFEYANFQIKNITNNELMNKGIKNELIRRIDRAVRDCEYGYITITETMKIINDPCSIGEDISEFYI